MSDDFIDDIISHHGVKGQKWGVRHERPAALNGVPNKTNRQAKKDAEEFTRAKLFYGQGAGTRRKLIKAKVETASSRDAAYKKAFDYHVANTDLAKRASQARSERHRKDVVNTTTKTTRGVVNFINGNTQAAGATAALIAGGVLYAHRSGIDRVVFNAAKTAYSNIRPDTMSAGARFIRDLNRH